MQEYGNYFNREDLSFYPLLEHNYLGDAVIAAHLLNDIDTNINIVRRAVMVLCHEALERHEAKFQIISQGKYHFFCVMFKYNSVTYYWWEKYENMIPFIGGLSDKKIQLMGVAYNDIFWDWRASDVKENFTYTLEFLYRVNPKVTYVAFSTNPNQSPLMCVGDFKNF